MGRIRVPHQPYSHSPLCHYCLAGRQHSGRQHNRAKKEEVERRKRLLEDQANQLAAGKVLLESLDEDSPDGK